MLCLPLLVSFFSLLHTSRGNKPVIDNTTESENAGLCNVRAWVRAPDLDPGKIVQGQVKIKANGTCDHIASYSLGLRFAERAWVKTRKAGREIPARPGNINRLWHPSHQNDIFSDPYSFKSSVGDNASLWEAYENDIKSLALWVVQEEERIAFEIRRPLQKFEDSGNSHVDDFAILLPLSQYPPAYNPSQAVSISDQLDGAGAEQIYAYFVEVTLVNGTKYEVPAGFTSFNMRSGFQPALSPEIVNMTTTDSAIYYRSEEASTTNMSQDIFTLEVTFPHGVHLQQGSANNISIIVHGSGPGLESSHRLWVQLENSPRNFWASSFAADNKTAKILRNTWQGLGTNQLRPSEHDYDFQHFEGNIEHVDVHGAYYAGNISLPKNTFPSYRMAHISHEHYLTFHLQVMNTSAASESYMISEEKEDYDWIPTVKTKDVQSSQRTLIAKIPIFVHTNTDGEIEGSLSNLTHYLSPEARSPIFIDPHTVPQWLQKSPMERDLLAPIAQPKVTRWEGEDVVKKRYYAVHFWPSQGSYYVGNTWLRKVEQPSREMEGVGEASEALIIQS